MIKLKSLLKEIEIENIPYDLFRIRASCSNKKPH